MRVAKTGDRYADIKIEIRIAIGIGDPAAFAFFNGQLGQERDRLIAGGDRKLFFVKKSD